MKVSHRRPIKHIFLCLWLTGAMALAQSQQPTTPPQPPPGPPLQQQITPPQVALPLQHEKAPSQKPNLEQVLESATDLTVTNKTEERLPQMLPFTVDTQIRIMGLFEPTTNKDLLPPSDGKESPYLTVENVPLRSMLHLLARRSGLNYLEPEEDQALEESISLEMKEPKPHDLLDWLLKHRSLELYDAGTGIFTIRKYTNQLSFYKFKLKDNFIDRFKGSAQGAGGGASGGGAVGFGGGNAVSANSGAIQVENGGKYGDIEGLLEKVANSGDEKNNKIWYYDEKQYVLLHGTRNASERITQYLEIANQRNPNIKIEVRIFGTGSNPASKLGFDWSSMMSPGLTFGLVPNATSLAGGGTNGALSGLKSLPQLASAFGHPLSTVVLRNDISATLNFFVHEAKAEALAQPSAITANGREVAFAATEQIPYISGSSVSGSYGGTSGVGYDNTAFVNVGTTINILPRIQDGKRLKLGTALSVSQLDEFVTVSSGTQGSPPRQVPKTSGRAFSGEFTVNSGDTVVLAGLRTSTTSKNRNKIPFLGDLPAVGKLFRNESNSKNTTYLTVFITATLLDDNNQPGIPVGKLTRQDSSPDPESTLSAEANMRHLASPSEWQDKAVVNAKREALDIKTQQANQIISTRLHQEEKLREMAEQLDKKEQEIQTLAARQKQLGHRAPLDGEGSIDAIQQDVETRLIRAKEEQNQMIQEFRDGQTGLNHIQEKEEKAKEEMEKAEEDYTKALGESFRTDRPDAAPKTKPAAIGASQLTTNDPPYHLEMPRRAQPKGGVAPSAAAVPASQAPAASAGQATSTAQSRNAKPATDHPTPKNDHGDELDENEKLLKRLQ
jgi:hypothetical protein